MMAIEAHYVECVAKKEKKTRICDTCGKEVDAWGYNRNVEIFQMCSTASSSHLRIKLPKSRRQPLPA